MMVLLLFRFGSDYRISQPFLQHYEDSHTRDQCNRATGSGYSSKLWRGFPILAEARIHQLRRSDRADCDHARRAGGEEALDQRGAVSPRAELLHATPRTRGAAACDVCRMVIAHDV